MKRCQTTDLLKSMRIWLPSCKQRFEGWSSEKEIIGDQYGKTVKISQRSLIKKLTTRSKE